MLHPVFTAQDFKKAQKIATLNQMVVTIRESMECGENSTFVNLHTPVPNKLINAIFNYLDNESNLLGKERSD